MRIPTRIATGRAISNAEEFGTWFRMKLEGAFAAGRYLDQVAAQWEDAAIRLKAFVEDR